VGDVAGFGDGLGEGQREREKERENQSIKLVFRFQNNIATFNTM
jgi:hypothetical protein